MMLLAHLLNRNAGWRDNPIRLLRVVENEEAKEEVRKHLIELGASSRIKVIPEVVVSNRPASEVIAQASASAAIVLLGFQTPDEGNEMKLYRRMEELAGDLPRLLFVDSAGGMALE
ncbi:MAG: hypothetical protein WBD31_05200 [Rubripirellula sp.]